MTGDIETMRVALEVQASAIATLTRQRDALLAAMEQREKKYFANEEELKAIARRFGIERDDARAVVEVVVRAMAVANGCTFRDDPMDPPCGDCCKVAVETILASLAK